MSLQIFRGGGKGKFGFCNVCRKHYLPTIYRLSRIMILASSFYFHENWVKVTRSTIDSCEEGANAFAILVVALVYASKADTSHICYGVSNKQKCVDFFQLILGQRM